MINWDTNWLAEKLIDHVGHDIEIVVYESEGVIHDVCVECKDCCEVLVSAEDYGQEEEE